MSVLFDPGYVQHTTILSISAEYILNNIAKFKNFGQRKTQYKLYYPKLVNMAENNVGFCLGCLLWATYIKSLGDNVEIEGNPCLGDVYNEAEAVEEIDYSIEFFTKLQKDAKYYLNVNYKIDPLYIKILELYKEFLKANCSFVNTKTTGDVILPKSFVTPAKEELEQIHSKIKNVIITGKLLDLVDVFNFVHKG